jgi:6-phosphofructokinase 1
MELYDDLGLDCLVCVGGDGTMNISAQFADKGANIVGVPKTIDKDLMETDTTFGFDSACAIATDAIDRLHSTAQSHHRVMIVEVMGRNAGWLALESGMAGGGDVVLIPEIPFEIDEIVATVRKRSRFGKRFSIIVVAEGAKPLGGEQIFNRRSLNSHSQPRLGGVGNVIADQIEEVTSIECRVTALGHLQRGGAPTAYDRVLSTRFAVKAVSMAMKRQFNHMVALKGDDITSVPIEKVMGKQRTVPLDSSLIKAARSVGTSLGARLE